MSPAPGLYICIKSWKKLYKLRLQRDFFETCYKWVVISPFCWHQNFDPWGSLTLPQGYIHVLNHEKQMYKSRLQRHFFFKLATNEWSDKTFLLISKLCPLGAAFPCPGAIYMYKIMKKNCIKSDFKEIFFKLATNGRRDKMFLLTSKFRPQGVVSPCPRAIYMYKIMKKKMYKIRLQRNFFF